MAKWMHPAFSRLVLRSSTTWIASAVLTMTTALALPCATQAQQQRQPNQQPIKDEQLTRLIQVSSVTVCNLLKVKTSFDNAIGATSNAISTYIIQVHGGKFEGVAESPTPEQIFQVITTNMALQSYQVCKELVPSDSAKKIEDVIKSRQSGPKK